LHLAPGSLKIPAGLGFRRQVVNSIRGDKMKCPYCEGEISDTVAKCRHCGEWVKQPTAAPSSRPVQYAPASYASAEQNVFVNAPCEESVAFAVVTLLFWIFLAPVGLILNLVGLLTGPRRGCFLSMLMFFVIIPTIVIFLILGLSVDQIVQWAQQQSGHIPAFRR
jgi:hypothetical protein